MYNVDENLKQISEERLPGYFGQWNTDKVIESYFENKIDGVCLDIGAADGVRGSNTYLFEKKGWYCQCVEPNKKHHPDLMKTRLNVYGYAISNQEGYVNLTIFDVGDKNIETSLTSLKPDERLVNSHKHIINDTRQEQVYALTFEKFLKKNGRKHYDFISIDTEGTELDVISTFPFDNVTCDLFVIENNYADESIRDFMKENGYKLDKRYKINDFYVRDDEH